MFFLISCRCLYLIPKGKNSLNQNLGAPDLYHDALTIELSWFNCQLGSNIPLEIAEATEDDIET